MIELTEEERSFLQNYLMDRYQDDSKRQIEHSLKPILNKLLANEVDFTDAENSYLQIILQELGEIHGNRQSSANDKTPLTLGAFRPQLELSYVTSIGNKLGALFKPSGMNPPDEEFRRSGPLQR